MGFQLNAPGKPYETTVNFRLAPGTSRATSEAKAERLRAAMHEGVGEEAVVSAKSRVGSSLDRDTGLVEQGANVGQIRFEFAMSDALLAAHPGTLDRIKDMLTGDPDVRSFSVDVPQAGPPAGGQFSARRRGRAPGPGRVWGVTLLVAAVPGSGRAHAGAPRGGHEIKPYVHVVIRHHARPPIRFVLYGASLASSLFRRFIVIYTRPPCPFVT